MSTNAVAFLLLHKHRDGVNIETLINSLDELRLDLNMSRKDLGFTGDSIDIVNYAIDLLGPGVVRREKINNEIRVKPEAILPNVIELNYYSNTLVTHYALDSIIAIAITCLTASKNEVKYSELLEEVLDLCKLMQYEFILCKPCQSLEHVVNGCIDDLIVRYKIFIENDESEQVQKSRRIAKQFDDDDDDLLETEKPYILNNQIESLEYLKFLRGLVQPLIETYAITAFVLEKLVGRSLLENELVEDVINELQLQLGQNTINYGE